MPPLHRDHLVVGGRAFTLKGGKLTFRTDSALFVQDARRAQEADADFTVLLEPPEGVKTVTGRVAGIELVPDSRPQRWEVVMRVTERG